MVLHLRKPKSSKKVQWQEEVVDNELLGRKRSKCKYKIYINTNVYLGCCIYTKPHKTDGDDSSSDDDSDWDDNCCHEHKVGRSYVPHNKGNTTPTDN